MSLHEPPARTDREPARRSRLRTLGARLLPWRGGPGRPRGGDWATGRERRRLAALDRRLTAETPQLASMFAMFEKLYGGGLDDGGMAGIEQLPPSSRQRPRRLLRWPSAPVAALITLAAVAALCFALSTQVVHSVVRPCVASSTASSTARAGGAVPVHTVSCSAYPDKK